MRRLALFLILCPLLTLSASSLYEEPRIVARPDYSLGIVFLEKWRGDVYLGVDRVIPLDDYLKYQLKESVTKTWLDRAQQTREQAALTAEPSGLIPEIELPKLPLFGAGSKIDISGHDRITFGSSQTVVRGATPVSGRATPLPELKMEQQLAVSLNGSVGDRTKVVIDHDSEREESQNKVKLSYTGTEDDVVQSVELGDTRLDIPGTAYTGDLPARHGLFGVAAKGKLGGADLYAIASREQSQNQSSSFTGQRRVSTDTIWDCDFVTNRFFSIDATGRILAVRVYVDDRNPANNQATVKGIATVFPSYPDSTRAEWSWDRAPGDFDLWSYGSDYVLHPGNIIEFLKALGDRDVVGLVVYTDVETLGGRLYHDSLVLKLLRPERTDTLSLTWDYMMRNCYALPQGDVKLEALTIIRDEPQAEQDLDYETAPQSPNYGRKFVEILGLDPNHDGRIEYPEFESKTGLIRFPEAKPFASTELAVRDSAIYRFAPDFLPPGMGRKYALVVRYYTITQSYYLGQTDITEGSERVIVNQEIWNRSTDYNINYQTGIITFLRPLPPDADIRVTFEYRPWFSLAQKSLVGTRAEWHFSDNGKVGSSVFYRSEGVPEDKPALGAEPFRRMIAESDASYSVTSDEVSAFLDRLPFLRAQAPSKFEASAEGALSLPDPNTMGQAYLDDFEGTTITQDLPATALLWTYASVPVGEDTTHFGRTPLSWNTPLEKVRKDSVFGPGIGEEGRETQELLRVVFTPNPTTPEATWAGMTIAPSSWQLGMNFKNIENLQLILRSKRGRGNIHVSIGMALDEDAPRRTKDGRIAGYNGRLDTEDRNGNGMLDEDTEDTGLDTIPESDTLWQPGSADDGNDDYDQNTHQQGTEGNRRLDSEDVDRNGFSRYNHYYECTIPLNDPRFASPLANGWQLYRLSLHDSTLVPKVGTPKWEDIRIVRIWFNGFQQTDTIDFYTIQFVGSRWRDPHVCPTGSVAPAPNDTAVYERPAPTPAPQDTFDQVWVTQISKKTDTSYVPPFEPKRDLTGRVETEAALLFGYRNLRPGRPAVVSKSLTVAEDYRDYQSLKLYAHDDGNQLALLLRVGTDSVNYYQFRSPITAGNLVPGRDGRWYEFTVRLDSFTLLKAERDTVDPASGTWTRGNYAITGAPSLAAVRYVVLGIENPGTVPVSGSIWFDDLRLSSPYKEPGYGFQARTGVSLSDFVSAALNFSYSDPNFRRFSEGRGVRPGGFQTDLGATVHANLDRLLPNSWGLSLPLSYSRSRSRVLPKFSARYPDLRVNREQALSEAQSGHSEDISLGNIRKQKSGNRLLNYTLEAIGLSWRRRRAGSQTVLTRDSSASDVIQWDYSISPEVKLHLPRDNELYPLPRNVRFAVTENRRVDWRGSRQSPSDTMHVTTTHSNDLNTDLSVEYSPIEDLSFDYGVETERDLRVTQPDSLWFLQVGTESGRNEDFSASYDIELGDILSPSFDFDANYSSDRPKLDTAAYAGYQNITNSGELTVNTTLELSELAERLEPRRAEKSSPDSAPRSGPDFRHALRKVSELIEPVELGWSVSRGSEYYGLVGGVPWFYRLGLSDTFGVDTVTSRSRHSANSIRASSGFRFRELTTRLGYNRSDAKDREMVNVTFDRSETWPEIELTLVKVHTLFSALATDSKLSTTYRRRYDLTGLLIPTATGRETLGMFGRSQSFSRDLNPLVSWQTTWKKRVNTTLALNYSTTTETRNQSESGQERSVTDTRSQGANASLSYTFSAPQGIKLPFLRKVRFSSDLSLTWQLRYQQTVRTAASWAQNNLTDLDTLQLDHSTTTNLAASYRFSRSVEAGVNTGYSLTANGITNRSNVRTDVDVWVLFRF